MEFIFDFPWILFKAMIAVSLLGGMFYCLMKHQSNKQFQRFMKPGDRCWYYRDEDRTPCVIQYIVNGRVVVLDAWGNIEEVNKDELFV